MMNRFANAFDCFEKCRHALKTFKSAKPWDDYKNDGDARIIEKRPFIVAKLFLDMGPRIRMKPHD
jgi:hypothetical protein